MSKYTFCITSSSHGSWPPIWNKQTVPATFFCRLTTHLASMTRRTIHARPYRSCRPRRRRRSIKVDREGKFKWQDDQVVFGFGKHKGKALLAVAEDDDSYLGRDKQIMPATSSNAI